MKKSNEISLKEAIKHFLESYNHKEKYNEMRLLELWHKTMGNTISSRTKNIVLKNKVLSIELDSAPLKNELAYAKEKIRTMLNTHFEEEIIKEIRVK